VDCGQISHGCVSREGRENEDDGSREVNKGKVLGKKSSFFSCSPEWRRWISLARETENAEEDSSGWARPDAAFAATSAVAAAAVAVADPC